MSHFVFAPSPRRSRLLVRRRLLRITSVSTLAALSLALVFTIVTGASVANKPATMIGGYEVPTIIDSAYAIPAGALFVAPNGSDRNPGTLGAPALTIGHAVAVAPNGATIVVRGGTYREALGSITKRVTIQAYPHEQVWLKGSVVMSGFAAAGSVWVKTGWSPAICRSCYPGPAIDPAYPAAGLPDQVFVDGIPQTQVVAQSGLRTGTFFVDTANHRLLLGTNPGGHTVEATVYGAAMQFNASASGSTLRGIGVADYAAHYNFDAPAMVVGNTTNLTFDRDTFAWSASRGLSVLRSGGVVTNNLFLYNGANGLHANLADGLIVQGNRFAYSNQEHFSIALTATASIAAMKVTSSKNVVVKGNTFDDNASEAVWFDLSAYNVMIANNTIVRNAGFGVEYELSAQSVIAGNVIAHNGRDGIKISGSTNTAIWNNTIVDNGWSQIGVYEDPRTQPNPALRSLGITWDTANITAFNNILAGGPQTTAALWNSFDASHPHHLTWSQMVPTDGRNLFTRPAVTQPAQVATWQLTLTTTTQWPTLAGVQAATAHEAGSIAADNTPLTSLFRDPAHDDFTLVPFSAAIVPGQPLPANVAAAMGVTATVHLGAPFVGVATGPTATTTVARPPTTVAAPTTAPPTTAPPTTAAPTTAPPTTVAVTPTTRDRPRTTTTTVPHRK